MDAGDAPPSILLSGETTTLNASPAATASPLGTQDVSFVVGPDGEIGFAWPSVWKRFFIGFGVPGIFMVLAFILDAISGDFEDEDRRGDVVGELACFACMGVPLLAIGMAIFGFTTGRNATGIGALVALAAFPFITIYLVSSWLSA